VYTSLYYVIIIGINTIIKLAHGNLTSHAYHHVLNYIKLG